MFGPSGLEGFCRCQRDLHPLPANITRLRARQGKHHYHAKALFGTVKPFMSQRGLSSHDSY
jgi:hypothetical protein